MSKRSGLRFDAAFGVTTEALVFLGELDPEAIGPNLEQATHYEPTPLDDAQKLLDAIPLDPSRATFVDLGSGMGRMVLLAARRPYRQVIGVEISPALHEVAKENRQAFTGQLQCGDIRLVRGDAASFALPRGDLAIFFYNPFRAPVMEAIVERLAADRTAREIVIAYHTPLERAVIEATGAFELVTDLGFGAVWRRKPFGSTPTV